MSSWKIYHNPECSKSREALALLYSREIQPVVIEYLKNPPTVHELRELIAKLDAPISTLVRTKEELYQQLNFDVNSIDVVAEMLAQHPKLLERPLVVHGDKAAIGRPIENIKRLFSDSVL